MHMRCSVSNLLLVLRKGKAAQTHKARVAPRAKFDDQRSPTPHTHAHTHTKISHQSAGSNSLHRKGEMPIGKRGSGDYPTPVPYMFWEKRIRRKRSAQSGNHLCGAFAARKIHSPLMNIAAVPTEPGPLKQHWSGGKVAPLTYGRLA